jgi:hypothetical protein
MYVYIYIDIQIESGGEDERHGEAADDMYSIEKPKVEVEDPLVFQVCLYVFFYIYIY